MKIVKGHNVDISSELEESLAPTEISVEPGEEILAQEIQEDLNNKTDNERGSLTEVDEDSTSERTDEQEKTKEKLDEKESIADEVERKLEQDKLRTQQEFEKFYNELSSSRKALGAMFALPVVASVLGIHGIKNTMSYLGEKYDLVRGMIKKEPDKTGAEKVGEIDLSSMLDEVKFVQEDVNAVMELNNQSNTMIDNDTFMRSLEEVSPRAYQKVESESLKVLRFTPDEVYRQMKEKGKSDEDILEFGHKLKAVDDSLPDISFLEKIKNALKSLYEHVFNKTNDINQSSTQNNTELSM